eukprot:3844347-Pleurochrysis_carterae.AAC.1
MRVRARRRLGEVVLRGARRLESAGAEPTRAFLARRRPRGRTRLHRVAMAPRRSRSAHEPTVSSATGRAPW